MSTGYLVPLRAGGVPLHLRAGETVIGRNELRTARKLVSKLHLRLDLSGSAALLTDTSINGTYVNGARLAREEPREVSSGDVVTLLTADSTDFAFVFVRCGGGSHASTDEAVIAPLLEPTCLQGRHQCKPLHLPNSFASCPTVPAPPFFSPTFAGTIRNPS